MPKILKFGILLILLIFIVWLFISGHWGWAVITFSLLIFHIISLFQNFKSLNSKNNPSAINMEITFNCTHCKNPNTQNLKICEWCGGQII